MKTISSAKKFLSKHLLSITIVVSVAVSIIIWKYTPLGNDFLSNLLATTIGLIFGIPVALWISTYQERSTEAERKEKILTLLYEELMVSFTQLNAYSKNTDKDAVLLIIGGFLRNESWKAFSEGGELEWIKDPDLLSELSWAYGSIQTLRHILDRYYSFAYHVGTRGDRQKNVIYLRDMAEKGISEGIIDIKAALEAISKGTSP
jgi:hypothetical protein